jgi:hypothetical protein
MRLFDRGRLMPRHYSIALLLTCLLAAPAFAIEPFPPGFHTEEIKTNGTSLHVRIGGQAPLSFSSTALAIPATCGRRRQQCW